MEKVKLQTEIIKFNWMLKNWWFGVENNNEKGQARSKIYMKINVSRMPPNQ